MLYTINKAMLLASGRLLILYSRGAKLAAIELNTDDPFSPVSEYEVPTSLK